MNNIFEDREDAGRQLAKALRNYAENKETAVLGLPRGGVPVAYEVASRLNLPMDIFLVRKLGVPGHGELAMGAVASGGLVVENDEVIRALRIPRRLLQEAASRELREIERRQMEYRGDLPVPDFQGMTVILIDDGLATGSTMRAAVEALRKQDVARIVVAVPVGAAATCDRLRQEADEVVCLISPDQFMAVGEWYLDFRQVDDSEVRDLLQRAPKFSVKRSGGLPH